MSRVLFPIILASAAAACLWRQPCHAQDVPAKLAIFRMQEIETRLEIGYAVLLVDINGDGKKDIVVADKTRVVWYENPTWRKRTILEGQTVPDNVCLAAYDIDGDGQIDLALGAGWGNLNPKREGTLQWLKRGKTLDDPWTLHAIGSEPMLHRIRFADITGAGKPALIVAPLLGRNSTAARNWMDGPVRLLAYKIPTDPIRGPWVPEVVDDSLHVLHNFWPISAGEGKPSEILAASYEGITLLSQSEPGRWTRRPIGAGNQANPDKNRGASEVKEGKLKRGGRYIAAIERWHGNQVVIYTPGEGSSGGRWRRQVLDGSLRWGHGVWCADLDGDGSDELIIGVRDNLKDQPEQRRGVRIYKALDAAGTKWHRQIIDDGGIAVEDLAAADLNNNGRVDIVAVGRQTHNLRIYWNQGNYTLPAQE